MILSAKSRLPVMLLSGFLLLLGQSLRQAWQPAAVLLINEDGSLLHGGMANSRLTEPRGEDDAYSRELENEWPGW